MPPIRLRGLVFGMLMVIAGCRSGLEPVELVSSSPLAEGVSSSPLDEGVSSSPLAEGVSSSPLAEAVNPSHGIGESTTNACPAPAFPGAEGFGANSVGGRGGRVIEVTNLNDRGPGSLREALEAEGPRIVVFRVAGIIELNGGIHIQNPYLTIAGQTAPGGGITIKGSDGNILYIHNNDGVHDVTIRYLRLRHGGESGSDDNLTIHSGHDIMIDHVSMSWSTDENAGIWSEIDRPPINNITFQRSIMAEGLFGHSNGMHISGEKDYSVDDPVEAWRQITDLTVHHNLFIHNTHRNPLVISGGTQVINNVVYNWKYRIGSTMSASIIDYIGNYYKVGPMTNPDSLLLHADISPINPDWKSPLPDPSIYITGNIVQPNHPNPNADNWGLLEYNYYHTPLPLRFRRLAPLPQARIPVNLQSASEAFDSVLADVGANARLDCLGNWVPNSDLVDLRLLDDVENGTGPLKAITSPDEVGGYPEIEPGVACIDSDHDGMPDEWEQLHNFKPSDPSDGPNDADSDGYTNIEEYLNGTDPRNGVICLNSDLPNYNLPID
jgi:pectate lyase